MAETSDYEPTLIGPTDRLHASWLEARDEWGRGDHQAGAGVWLAEDLDLDTPNWVCPIWW